VRDGTIYFMAAARDGNFGLYRATITPMHRQDRDG
jgi:hypothetical protein